ncbi:MAG TPA: mechanosensitive ion channel domain-containing protein [Polyangiaceae bacterium]|jgi:small-conductance mechanosensitive channel
MLEAPAQPPAQAANGDPISVHEASLPIDAKARVTIGVYLGIVAVLAVVHLLVHEKVGPLERLDRPIVERVLMAGALVSALIAFTVTINALVIDRLASAAARHNLRRILSLVRAVVIGVIALSLFFASWYTALVSLGLVSLILGFALQTPITSFIGWIYVLLKTPYRVGDRIRLGDAGGDVVDVTFLDTVLWEIGGPYVSTDDPSGRIIRVPNSLALNTAVYNYTTPNGFPFVWNEVKVLLAYGSDLEFVARTMETAAASRVTSEIRQALATFRRAVARTPIDPRSLHERPVVIFRSHESSWLEATVRYLVDPRQATDVKASITREVLGVLGNAPERVLLPAGAER